MSASLTILKCAGCDKFLHKVPGQRKKIKTEDEANYFGNKLQRTIAIRDILCGKCRLFQYKKNKLDTEDENDKQSTSNDSTVSIQLKPKVDESNDERIEVQIQRTVSTHKYCCICSAIKNIIVIPEEARMQSFIKLRLHIPAGNRCCRTHLIRNRFYDEDLNRLRVYSNSSNLSASELTKMMESLSIKCDSTLYDEIGEFSLSEKQLLIFTGLTWENIILLRNMLTSMRNRQTRTVTQALVVFLFKLRTGNSNKLLASILQIEYEQLISEYSTAVLKSFEEDVLPYRFGITSSIRDDLIENHTTEIAKNLFDIHEHLFLICDGTYARHQKSSNNEFQKKTYSGQKKVPLCKPFTICTTDGYVIDMLGPYPANLNDAEILRTLLQDPNGLCKLLKENDIMILDRGFRDVKAELELKKIRVLMPALKGKRKQLTTKEPNESRYVTKIRWTVEAVHGILKQKYRLLEHKLDNKMLPKIGTYFRIASFLNNQFGKRLQSDAEFSSEIIERMKTRKDVENTLAADAEEKGWLRKKLVFQNISSEDILDFPEMTIKDLKILFTGTYQLSQAVSYLAEMVDKNGQIKVQYVKEQSNVLKLQVPSRHINRKMYRCFLKYKPNNVGISGLLQHSCDCANGNRTVGCCSHVAAIVYYLAHARYLSKILKPAEILSEMFQQNNIIPIIEENSDED